MRNKYWYLLTITVLANLFALPAQATETDHDAKAIESWAEKPSEAPDHTTNAMDGVLDFLRNNPYHESPSANPNYRPWMAASTAAFLNNTLNYGLFDRKFEKGSTRVIENNSYGSYQDRHLLPYLNPNGTENDDAMASFLYMKAYGLALEKLLQEQEARAMLKSILTKLNHPMANQMPTPELVKATYGPNGRSLTIADPRIANLALSPQKALDKLLYGNETTPITTADDEHQKSTGYVAKINELLHKQSGPAIKFIDPNLVMNLRHETNQDKAYSMKTHMEGALIENLSHSIFEELMAPLKNAEPELSPEQKAEMEASPKDQPYNDASQGEQQLQVCLVMTYENLLSRRRQGDVSIDDFLTELHEYEDHCYNTLDPNNPKIAQNLRATNTLAVLTPHIAIQQIPLLRAKGIEGQSFDKKTRFEAELIHAILGKESEDHVLDFLDVPEEDDEIKPVTHNPLKAEFWSQNRETGALLKKYGIGILTDRCGIYHKVSTPPLSDLIFNYSNCPALTFDKSFMAQSSKFLSDPEAVASVYDMMTSSGFNPGGAQQFKNLLTAIEFQRRAEHAKALTDKTTTEPYKSHPIFDVSNEANKTGEGFAAAMLVCKKRPPYALSVDDPCSMSSPDPQFVAALGDAFILTNTQMKIQEASPGNGRFAVSTDFRSNDELRDPLLVGGSIFVLANADPSRGKLPVNVFDEMQHHSMVRQAMASYTNLSEEYQKAAMRSSYYTAGLNTFTQAYLNVVNNVLLPKSLESHWDTEKNDDMYRQALNFNEAKEYYNNYMAQLGINQQHQGIYQTKSVKRIEKNEKGEDVEQIFRESEACHQDKLDPKMSAENQDAHSRNMSVYQRMYTCFQQANANLIQKSTENFVEGFNQAKSDVLWTAASVVTMPVGGVAVFLSKAALAESAAAIHGGYVAYRAWRALPAAARVALQAEKQAAAAQRLLAAGSRSALLLNATKNLGAAPFRFAANQGKKIWNASAEISALRTARIVHAYKSASMPMVMGVGMFKGFGAIGTGIQQVRQHYRSQNHPSNAGNSKPESKEEKEHREQASAESTDAWARVLLGGQDPASLQTIAGIMIIADNLALGVKNWRLSRYIKKNPNGLPADRVNLLRHTDINTALPELPHVMGNFQAALSRKYLKMSAPELAKQTPQIQESVLWYRRMRMSPAELAKESKAIQNIVNLKKLDLSTTRWGNHLGADLPLTTYFQWTSWWYRDDVNAEIYAQLEKFDAAILEASHSKDHDAVKKYAAQRELSASRLQGDFAGFDFFDTAMDALTAVAFRGFRPGDFGGKKLFEAHETAMDDIVNTTLSMPSVKKFSAYPDSTATRGQGYIVNQKDMLNLRNALMAQEEKFTRIANPQDLANAPQYVAVTVVPNNDGTYTLTTQPGFKGWKVSRYRDHMPAPIKAIIDAASNRLDPTEPGSSSNN